MTLTELRYIVAVATEGHFGRAAKSCFVSQPTLSLGIKKLEDELGVTLFERRHKDLLITPIGKKIIAQAKRVLHEVNTVAELADHNHRGDSTLRLGALFTIGPYLIPDLLPALHDRVPNLKFTVEENYSDVLLHQLRQGDIDAAILSLPIYEPGLDYVTLYEEPFVILLPASHPLTMQSRLSIKDISKEVILLPGPRHDFRDQVLQICTWCTENRAGGGVQGSLQDSSLETIRYMVAAGVGITILPITAACADKYAQRLMAIRRFYHISPIRHVAIAWRKHYPHRKTIKLLADAVWGCVLSGVKMQPLREFSGPLCSIPNVAPPTLN